MGRRSFQVLFGVSVVLALGLTLRPVYEPSPPPFPYFDKLAHAGMWFLMGCLGGGAFQRTKANLVRLVTGLCLLGVSVEVAQYWIPGRSLEFLDGAADCLGALVAFALWFRTISSGNDSEARPQDDPVV